MFLRAAARLDGIQSRDRLALVAPDLGMPAWKTGAQKVVRGDSVAAWPSMAVAATTKGATSDPDADNAPRSVVP